ncbi:MAG: DNA-processing protein DprA [Planctomycetota bacterium]
MNGHAFDEPPAVPSDEIAALLRLTLARGVGPVLVSRLLDAFGDADAALGGSAIQLARVPGIGPKRAEAILRAARDADEHVDRELALAGELGVRLVPKGSAEYPVLLDPLLDAPHLLYVRGVRLRRAAFRVAMVGSRTCTAYGIEQAERFGSVLAGAGLEIVSGGARGIDTAGHRGALRGGAPEQACTVAVLGCGLAECYPPENAALFDEIARRGSVVSELPLRTRPSAENFPARNRLISGMSLGVIVIEAGLKSGALITARLAAEDHGREVLVLPGRVDSRASDGSHHLLKQGGGLLVTEPGDVIAALEGAAGHQVSGTHGSRYGPESATSQIGGPETDARADLSDDARSLLNAVGDGATVDELIARLGVDVATARRLITRLELAGILRRDGTLVRRVDHL